MKLPTSLWFLFVSLQILFNGGSLAAQTDTSLHDSATQRSFLSYPFVLTGIGCALGRGFGGVSIGVSGYIETPACVVVGTLNALTEVDFRWEYSTAGVKYGAAMFGYDDQGKEGYFCIAAGPAYATGEYRRSNTTGWNLVEYSEVGVAAHLQLFGIRSSQLTPVGIQIQFVYCRSAPTGTLLMVFRL